MPSKLMVLLCFLFAVTIANAQSYKNDASKKYAASPKSKKKVKEKVYKDNIAKLNISGLIIKSVGLQYERKFKKKKTFAFGLIYRPKGSWTISKFYDTTTASTGLSQETKFMLASSKYRALMLTPELRYYFSRQAPRGLYLAAFARCSFEKTEFNFHYNENNDPVQKIGLANLNETMIGGGLMLGFQIVTRKQWTLDFWFLGPWIGDRFAHLKSKVNGANILDLQQKFISQDIKPLLGKETDIKWNENGISTKYNYFSIGARLLGINFGWNF